MASTLDSISGSHTTDGQPPYEASDEIISIAIQLCDPDDNPMKNLVSPCAVCSSILLKSFPLQRFHIKWKNLSHLHNTDETHEFLKRYMGTKHVDNQDGMDCRASPACERHDLGENVAYQIDKEHCNELLGRGPSPSIMLSKTTPALQYNDATWESK